MTAFERIGLRLDEQRIVRSQEALRLPTEGSKYPTPSTPLLGKTPLRRTGGTSMKTWRVSGIDLDPHNLIPLLPLFSSGKEITQDGRMLAPGVIMGLDFCYVMECYRFAASLLERGRFLPDLRTRLPEAIDGEMTGCESVWRPLLLGGDAERFRTLARIMPGGLRLEHPAFDDPSERPLHGILECMIDGIVRYAWSRKRMKDSEESEENSHGRLAGVLVKRASPDRPKPDRERRKRGRLVSPLNPHALWTRSLGWSGRRQGGGDPDALSRSMKSIYGDVRDWWQRFEWLALVPYKLCLALEERRTGWRLEYFMKELNTGRAVPAETIWRASPDENEGASYMRRYMLLFLGRIGATVEAVKRSMRLPAPTGCALSTAEASDFIACHATTLASQGICVILPEWCREDGGHKLRIRGRLLGGKAPRDFLSKIMRTKDAAQTEEPLTFRWELVFGETVLTTRERTQIMEEGASLLKIDGRWAFIHPDQRKKLRALLEKTPSRLAATEALRLSAETPHFDGFLDAPELEEAYDALAKGGLGKTLPMPTGMRGALRPYQLRGYSWLCLLSNLKLGACLADDMGLGKTVQALATIQHHRNNGENRPVLLVCPTSVLENWRLEIARFLPDMRTFLHHGPHRPKGDDFTKATRGTSVVLSSYAILQRDTTLYRRIEWAGIILDEAQNIKNPDTQQSRTIRGMQADWRLVLTGTPVENHVGDLWSIMEFLMPGMLGSRRGFVREYVKPIQEEHDLERMKNLNRAVAPFILRRLKSDKEIAPELPPKIETKVFCGLGREQIRLYAKLTSTLDRDIAKAEGIKRKGLVLAALTRAKQICDHPSLVLKDGDFGMERSAKMKRALELADEMFEAGDRVLFFTQYVEMGDILKIALQERFGKEVLFLHGGVPKDSRDRMIRFFQEKPGPRFFILSLKAGGVGLNLTNANHIVLYDRWWNPAVERQAIDRAHRIGQTHNVHVHVFCCKGTLEERIDEISASKKEIADRIVDSGENWITELSDGELSRFFSLGPGLLET